MKTSDFLHRPKVAVHKFSSCDGCQLTLLNLGEKLLQLNELVEFVHFAEAGIVDEEAKVEIAIVEGSVSAPAEQTRIKMIRANSKYLITIGACATTGGLQALRNLHDAQAWTASVYARPEYISSLATSTAISQHARVDLELWGCPINGYQILSAIRALLSGVTPAQEQDKLCSECKRLNTVCVMVAKGMPCMGPVTRTGCGVLCPRYERDCFACYGPAENPNTASLTQRLRDLGSSSETIARRFLFINNNAPVFAKAGQQLLKDSHESTT